MRRRASRGGLIYLSFVADPMQMLQRGCRITLEIEVENALKIFKRLDRKDDHAMRRGLGRADLPPRARFSR